MISFTLTTFATVIGVLILGSRDVEFLGVFLVVGYLAVLSTMARSIGYWRDILNPLCMLLSVCFIRYSVPAYLIGQGDVAVVPFFDRVGYQTKDWQLGHVLAVTGWSAFALGWSLVSGQWCRGTSLRLRVPRPVAYASVAGMVIGLVFLITFVRSNGGTMAIIASGAFRGIEIQRGTGIFFHLSQTLIVSSVVLAGYFVADRRSLWVVFMPITVAMLAFWVLGGRGRALTPVMSGFLLMWYAKREEEKWGRIPSFRYIVGALIVLLLLWVVHFGILYRGLGLESSLARSVFDLWGYVRLAFFSDIGQLHSLAGAVRMEPGALYGRSFLGFLWPLSVYLELPGRNAGPWMTEQLIGEFAGRRWGLNPTLIGDAYMNFGVVGVPVVMMLFGIFLKSLYSGFRQGRIHAAVYAVVIGFGFHVFFGSVNKWAPLNLALLCAFALFFVGTTLLNLKPAPKTIN